MGFKRRRSIAFAPADGWVLAAAAHAGMNRPATWRAIIASADYMNRAILTFDELAGAAARLDASGLVRYESSGLTVSPSVARLVDGDARDLRRRFARVWDLPVPAAGPATRLSQRLARSAYDEAVRIHRAWG